jgi:lipoprotein LprG
MVNPRLWIVGVFALIATLLVGCSGSNPAPSAPSSDLPSARTLLAKSSASMKSVTSVHFKLKIDGEIPSVPVNDAEGDLRNDGSAKGKAKVSLLGRLIEADFLVISGEVFIKGPTGGFTKVPANIYDPSVILDPNKGISVALLATSDAKTEAKEDVDGTATYKVTGKLRKEVIALIVPGVDKDVDCTYWVVADDKNELRKAAFKVPVQDGKSATVTITVSDFNKPVEVSKP